VAQRGVSSLQFSVLLALTSCSSSNTSVIPCHILTRYPLWCAEFLMSLFGSAAATSSTAPNTTGDISKDVALTSPPDDSVSEVAFNPAHDFLAVSSWDSKVRIYEINEQGQSQGKAQIEFGGPVLGCAWSQVGIPRYLLSVAKAI